MYDCIFCKVVADGGDNIIWESDLVAAFPDKYPDAPVHILIVPKRHVARLSELDDFALGGELLRAAREIAKQEDIEAFRFSTNNGRAAGQVIDHLHFHLTAGN